MGLKRLFVAVSLTDEARHRLAAGLAGVALPGSPVRPNNWHLTLRFLGATDEATTDRIRWGLDEADLGERFGVSWGGLGAFPRPTKASVVWIGLNRGSEELEALSAAVDAVLERVGIPPRDRDFRPHLTIGRLRPPQDVADLIGATPPLGGKMIVESVELYESHLGRGGSVYEVHDSFRLG